MMRGARVNMPPLHSLADVIGVLLLLAVLYLVIRTLLGGSPVQDFADFLRPPAMATVIAIEIGMVALSEGLREELVLQMPVSEKAIASRAVEKAAEVGQRLDGHRESWRFGTLRVARVRENAGQEAWDDAWRKANERGRTGGETEPGSGGVVVTLIALIIGRSVQTPKRVTAEEIGRFVLGLGRLDVRHVAAFGALCSPEAGALSEGELLAGYPELVPL